MKLIIAGSRDLDDSSLLEPLIEKIIKEQKWNITEVVSGTARGADTVGEFWAERHGINVKKFPADWAQFGKSAGPRRNAEMAKYADAAIVFILDDSRGSTHMFTTMQVMRKPAYAFNFQGNPPKLESESEPL
jgi:hypothetical protein